MATARKQAKFGRPQTAEVRRKWLKFQRPKSGLVPREKILRGPKLDFLTDGSYRL